MDEIIFDENEDWEKRIFVPTNPVSAQSARTVVARNAAKFMKGNYPQGTVREPVSRQRRRSKNLRLLKLTRKIPAMTGASAFYVRTRPASASSARMVSARSAENH